MQANPQALRMAQQEAALAAGNPNIE